MSFLEARQALDKSLASPAWTDYDAVAASIKRQLGTALEEQNAGADVDANAILGESNKGNVSPPDLDGNASCDDVKGSARPRFSEKVLEARTQELIRVLESLRSAGEADVESLALNSESIREDGVDSGNDRQWRLKEEGKEHRVLYRKGPEGTPLHEICLEGIINGPIDTLLALVWEVPFFKDWWPQFTVPPFKVLESKFAKRIAPGFELSYLQFKAPWPFKSRELLFLVFLVQDTSTGLFVGSVLSPPEHPCDLDPETSVLDEASLPPLSPSLARMTVDGGFAGQDLGGGRSYFRCACMLDLKLDLLPPWVINFVARQLAGSGYHLLNQEVETVVKASNASGQVTGNKAKGCAKISQLIASEPLYVGMRNAMEEYRRAKEEAEERRRTEGSAEEEGRLLRTLGGKVEEEVERLVLSLSKREVGMGPEEAGAALLQLEAAAASAVALTVPSQAASRRAAASAGAGRGRGDCDVSAAAAATIAAAASAATAAAAAAAASSISLPLGSSSGPLPLGRHGGSEAEAGMASLLRETSSVRSGPLPSIRTVTGSSTSSGSNAGVHYLMTGDEVPGMLRSGSSGSIAGSIATSIACSSRSSFSCGGASGSSSLSSSGSSSPSSYPGLYHRDPAIFRAVATLDKAILFVRARAAAAEAAAEGSEAEKTFEDQKLASSVAIRCVSGEADPSSWLKSSDMKSGDLKLGDVSKKEVESGFEEDCPIGVVDHALEPIKTRESGLGKVEDEPKNASGKRISLTRIGRKFLGMRTRISKSVHAN